MKQFEVVTSNGDITIVNADEFRFNHAGNNNIELTVGSGSYVDVVGFFHVGPGFSIIRKDNIVDDAGDSVTDLSDDDIPF